MTDTCRYLQITTFGLANEMFNVSQPQKVGYGSDEKSLDLDPCHCHVNFKKRDLHQNATELGLPPILVGYTTNFGTTSTIKNTTIFVRKLCGLFWPMTEAVVLAAMWKMLRPVVTSLPASSLPPAASTAVVMCLLPPRTANISGVRPLSSRAFRLASKL